MSSRSERFSFSLAKPEDGPEILKVYESLDFKGDISVMYTRRPDPLASLAMEGDEVLLPLMQDNSTGRIAGMGCWILRQAYIDGQIKRVCYLMSLKILPDYQRRMPHLKEVYAHLYALTKGKVDLYYTTILKENITAQRMLEKKRPQMPEYRYGGDYTVYNIKTGGRLPRHGYTIIRGADPEGAKFYQHHAKDSDLASPDLTLHGIGPEDMYVMRSATGEILAVCYLWNQQPWKQHIVTGYGGLYGLLHHLPVRLLGYPSFPPVGKPIDYASIAGLCVKDDSLKWASLFIRHIAALESDYLFLMLGFHQTHPLNGLFETIKHIKYQSRFYTVHFEDELEQAAIRPIALDVGLL